jgi:dienelactone hydrolase
MKKFIFAFLVFVLPAAAQLSAADLHEETVAYAQDGNDLEGYLVYDGSNNGKMPGILIFHQWKGLSDYEKMRARMFAGLGYAVFCADIYGKGIRPEGVKEASGMATKFRMETGRKMIRNRALAALEKLKSYGFVDPEKIAAVGYCFGGGCALELARSGADIKGVITFHGNLDAQDPMDAKNIRAKILVLHGAADPNVPWKTVDAFRKEMDDAKVDWYLTAYGGAVHSFTQKEAGNDPSKGAAYNEKADMRSWQAGVDFLREIFK